MKARFLRSNIIALAIVVFLLSTSTLVFADTDNFERADGPLGANWSANPDMVVKNGNLHNQSTLDSWNFLAIYTALANPNEVSMEWAGVGDGTDESGVELGGLLIVDRTDYATANGYWIYYRTGSVPMEIRLWTIQNGALGSEVDAQTAGSPAPTPGSVMKVIFNSTTYSFQVFIDGTSVGTLNDAAKQVSFTNFYGGVLLRGNRNNDVESFSANLTSDTTAPDQITDLAATATGANTVQLTWTATGDDGNTGTASSYDVRYSTSLITDANFASATAATGEPAPKAAGQPESFTVSGLNPETQYYFAIKASDEAGNTSPMSNVVDATTEAGSAPPPSGGSVACTTDDFERTTLGSNWAATAQHEIRNGELALTSDASGWNYLATYTRPGAVQVSMQLSATNSQVISGGITAGLAILLDAPSATANGYWIYRKDRILVYTITGGVNGTQIATVTGSQPDPQPGDVVKAVITDNGDGTKTIEYYINGNLDATFSLNNAAALEDLYVGVMQWGGGADYYDHNNIDNFTPCYPSGGGPFSMIEYDGNNQHGPILQQLPLPIEVQVLDEQGAPFKGAVLDFQVVQGQATLDDIENFNFDGKVWKEVEEGNIISPASAQDDPNASGGKYVAMPYISGYRDKRMVEIPVYLPELLNYDVWLRFYSPNGNANSCYMSVDGGDSVLVNTNILGSWEWKKAMTVTLDRGFHTVIIINREPSMQWDKILLANTQLGYNPSGTGGTGPDFPNVTDSLGIASTHVTFKTDADTNVVVEVSGYKNDGTLLDGAPVQFTLNPDPGPATTLAKDVATDNQIGAPQSVHILRVRVLDQYQNRVAGITVNWQMLSGNGTISDTQTLTDDLGEATTALTLGTTDSFKVQASSPTLPGQDQIFTAYLGKKAKLMRLISGTPQTGTVGQQLPNPLVVEVIDEDDQPYDHFPVNFEVISGGGTIDGQTSVQVLTGADGRASVYWTLGPNPGLQTVRATASVPAGSPVDFQATAEVGPASKLVEVSGNNQQGPVGLPLLNPFVIQVTDEFDNPIAGETVKFEVIQGDGAYLGQPGTLTVDKVTDADGKAEVTLTMGTVVGETHYVRASAVSFTASPVTFQALATEPIASQIHYVSGGGQDTVVTNPLPAPFVVQVLGPFGNPVQGQTVIFQVVEGEGNFDGAAQKSVLSDENGYASATLTLGTIAGDSVHVVHAISNRTDNNQPLTGSPVVFKATGLPGPAAKLVKDEKTDAQTGRVGEVLPTPIKAKVTDIYGNPISSYLVAFEVQGDGGALIDPLGGGEVPAVQVTTGADGAATISWKMPVTPGVYELKATALYENNTNLDGSPAIFTATAAVAPAYKMESLTADTLAGTVGQDLLTPVRVRITDIYGNPVGGYSVSFVVTEGGGKVNNQDQVTVQTSADSGIAEVTWKLGTKSGVENNLLEARAGNIPENPVIVFKASGLPDVAKTMIPDETTNYQTGTVGLPLANPIKVQIVDQYNNGIPGFPVTFHLNEVNSNIGSIDGAIEKTVPTDELGFAKVDWVLGPKPGSKNNEMEVSARRGGTHLVGSPHTFWASAQIGGPDSLKIVSGNYQEGRIGNPLTEPLRVKVTDAFGNAIAGQEVTFRVLTHTLADGGTLDGEVDTVKTKITDSNGIAFVLFTLGKRAGKNNHQVQARAEFNGQDLKGSPVIFYESAVETNAKYIAEAGGNDQTGIVGNFLQNPLQVKATDEFGNPVRGQPIQFRIIAGDGFLGDDTMRTVTINTENDGIARVKWRLGTQVGSNKNMVEATSSSGTGPLSGSPINFKATAIADITDAVQSDIEVFPVEVPADGETRATIKVTLRDRFKNPVVGKAVFITASGTDNVIVNPMKATDANGEAVGYIASTKAQVKYIKARDVNNGIDLADSAKVTFTPLPAYKLEKLTGDDGDAQTRNIGTVLEKPLKVVVYDKNNNPIRNHPVNFVVTESKKKGRILDLQPVVTDSNGVAIAHYRLGEQEGLNRIEARATDANGVPLVNSPQRFIEEGVKSPPATIEIVSGNGITARASDPLPEPLVVRVLDVDGRPIWGVDVKFEPLTGGGTITSINPDSSDMYGKASATAIAGTVIPLNIFKAYLPAYPNVQAAIFTINVTANAASVLKYVSGNDQRGTVGRTLFSPFCVRTEDQHGNPVAGVAVSFTVIQGMNGGSLEGGVTVLNTSSDANGIACATYTLGTKAGENIIRASASNLQPNFIEFKVQGEADYAFTMAKHSGDNQVGEMGKPLANPICVIFKDRYGNPARNGLATFVVTQGGGYILEQQPVSSGSNGLACARWVLGPRENNAVINEAIATTSLPGGTFTETFKAKGDASYWPVFHLPDPITVDEGDTVAFKVYATDDDGDQIYYDKVRLPEGAVFDAATQMFTWITDYTQGGKTYYAVFRATDSRNSVTIDSVAITVRNVNRPPEIVSWSPSSDNLAYQWGEVIVFSVQVVDPDEDDQLFYQWTLNGELKSTEPTFSLDTKMIPLNMNHEIKVTVCDFDACDEHVWLATKVELSSFSSEITPFKGVTLEWETASEVGNLGFNVLRSLSENGTYEKINDKLIPSSPGRKYTFTDNEVRAGQRYYYKIEDVSTSGFKTQHGPVLAEIALPKKFDLSQNYPNPFNPTTKIRYQLPEATRVKLEVFNIMGQVVRTLVDEQRDAGYHVVEWDGRSDAGTRVGSGVYYYRIIAGDHVMLKKMALLK